MNLTTVGVLARIEVEMEESVRSQLGNLEGVELFELGDAELEPGQIGLLIEAATVDAAHEKIKQEVATTVGVLCAWPVYVHYGDDEVDEGMEIEPAMLASLCAPT